MPLDLADLRAKAEAATPGPWRTGWADQDFYVRPTAADQNPDPWGYDRIAEWTFAIDPGNSDEMQECDTANGDYIAAVSPDVVLELLDRIEVLTKSPSA